ncbi:hypothetical protein F5B21DRAFT_220173 [Xylaria acuta]|nr:hypothetical protein F5B21DRAFT_220173 [Xylaria acuta]
MTKWAILIGISSYARYVSRDKQIAPLRGAIQDVEAIRNVLCSSWGFNANNVTILTSPGLEKHSPGRLSAEAESPLLPTYENIFGAISSTMDQASPGDVVYLHFSALTSNVKSLLSPVRSHPFFEFLDYTILPFNFTNDGKCIRDVEMASVLRKHAAQGIEITLVVDGRRITVDYGVRFNDHSPFQDIASVSQVSWRTQGRQTWLQNPGPHDSFTLLWLQDWQPYKDSLEMEFYDTESQHWHGALSYWLLHLLRSEAGHHTYKTFVQCLWRALRVSGWHTDMDLYRPNPNHFLITTLETPFLGGSDYTVPKIIITLEHYEQLCKVLRGDHSLGQLLQLASPRDFINEAHCSNSSPMHLTGPTIGQCNQFDQYEGRKTMLSQLSVFLRPDVQARLYEEYLQLEYHAQVLSDDVEVSLLGGYGYDAHKNLRIPYFSGSTLNLVSGDYAVIRVTSTLAQPLFLRVLCFDSAFGVSQVFPLANSNIPDIQRPQWQNSMSNKIIHLRLFLPMQRKLTKDMRHVTEILKVLISDTPFKRPAIQMPTVQDMDFLAKNPDPVSSAFNSSEVDNGLGEKTRGRSIRPDSGVGQPGIFRNGGEVSVPTRCSYTIHYVLHESEETFAPPFYGL